MDIDPCGICCAIVIILVIVSWAYSVSPFFTILFLAILGIIIIVCIVRIRINRRRRLTVERPTAPQILEPAASESETTKTVSIPKADRCLFCGFNLNDELEICPECGEQRVKCSVCQLNIVFGDNIIRCPFCDVLSHRDHLLEWIKIRGFCPNCRKILSENEITK